MAKYMPSKIVIVGGGTAGYISAVALSKLYDLREIDITLVESDDIGIVGVGEATVPHIRLFNEKIGIDEQEFMAATNATFKLGIEFCDWDQIGKSYIHPFGDFGRSIAGLKFHQIWRYMKENGVNNSIFDYSFPVQLANAQKFDKPNLSDPDLTGSFSYAYQFDATLYAAFLRKVSLSRGVKRVEGKVTNVNLDSESGFVKSIQLESGKTIEGELFIDCTGLRGLLIGGALETKYDDWSHYLPADRAWAMPCAIKEDLSPYTRATAKAKGWQWRIPLRHRIGNGFVYSSRFCDDDEALETLKNSLEGEALGDPRLVKFKTGIREKFLNKNVVSIGLSAGFLEPLESTSIHLIQLAITNLIEIMPDLEFSQINESEYNRVMFREFESVRDFLILHYHATKRNDSDYWNYLRTMEIPDSLRRKMSLFKERGIVEGYKDGFFLEASWLAVYFGQGIVPDDFDPAMSRLNLRELRKLFEYIPSSIQNALVKMPSHEHYLAKNYGISK